VFNRFFMPPGLCIEYATRRAAMHNVLQQIGHYMGARPTRAYHHHFSILVKIVHHLDVDRVSGGVHLDETVGKLVCASNGREFIPCPGTYTILRGPKLSPRFLSRSGEWWPCKNLSWQEADYLGLYRRTPKANRKDTADTVNPQLLILRGENRA
jgi:hypothetical protein